MSGQAEAARARLIADAFVYIAASRDLELLKIGWSKGAHKSRRMDSLNKDGYGGTSDWLLLYERESEMSGWVEIEAHKKLSTLRVREGYIRLKHGLNVRSKEMFSCNYSDAFQAIESTSYKILGPRYERHDAKTGYNYRI